MATATVRVYPAVFVTHAGKVGEVHSFSNRLTNSITAEGDFFVPLPIVEVEVEVPSEESLRKTCQTMLAVQANDLRKTAELFEQKADQIGSQA